MHVQIVTFNLKGTSKQEYEELCDQLAPAFGAMPGLITKVWLADDETTTYGGVYLWRDEAAYDAYVASDIFKGVGSHPGLSNVDSKAYGILESPSAVTRALAFANS
jgi:heme-degrading monooxygenase HmoA